MKTSDGWILCALKLEIREKEKRVKKEIVERRPARRRGTFVCALPPAKKKNLYFKLFMR